MRVVLVEEGWHATMPIARALEAAGCAVTVVTANGSTARHTHRSVAWISGPRLATGELPAMIDGLGADRVIPLTESAMLEVAGCANVWPALEPWQRALVGDKHALVEHMAARGIAIPYHTRDLTRARVPTVIKGATGSGGRQVRIAETADELAAAITRARELGGSWIAQELIAGPTYLVGGLFDAGRPLRIYAAEKLEQYPPRTGGAIAVRSTTDPALLAAGVRAIRELRWTGFASADFVRDERGCLLLEINPRLWGSYAGAAAAGVELFAPFAQLVLGETPAPALELAAARSCLIFPRYLNAAKHRTLAGLRQALRDLRIERDWLDPRFAFHLVRRLRAMRRYSHRF